MNCSVKLRIVNHRKKWAAVEVPRCGCTTLKMIAAKDNLPSCVELPVPNMIHKFLGYSADSSGGIVVPSCDFSHQGYVRFAVWRDPIERMASLWKMFCSNEIPWVHPFCGAASSGLVGCSWDEFCEYLKWVHSAPPCAVDCSDHHLARQVDIYGPGDVDVVVMLPDLCAFMSSLGCNNCPIENSSTKSELDTKINGALQDLLIGDYEIPKWGKVWQSTTIGESDVTVA